MRGKEFQPMPIHGNQNREDRTKGGAERSSNNQPMSRAQESGFPDADRMAHLCLGSELRMFA